MGDKVALRKYVDDHHPADLADAMMNMTDEEDLAVFQLLTPHEQAEVLDEANETTLKHLLASTDYDRLAEILGFMAPDEAADVLGVLPEDQWAKVLAKMNDSSMVEQLIAYDPKTAGGLMSLGYALVKSDMTATQAIEAYKAVPDVEPISYVYVVQDHCKFVGSIDLHRLISANPEALMSELTNVHSITVPPDMDQEHVALVFARYDLNAVAVVDPEKNLLGIITADDIIDVIQEEATEDIAKMSGTDAHELERKSPAKIAMMRMPWIMATMLIELVAGFVVKVFDHTLAQVLLLASFMPIISAISGKTGLQSAAIIIRGLSTGHVKISEWRHAVARQLGTTVILGAACGITLGVIGAIWYGKWTFGLLVTVGMFASVNIAGAVGTAIPLVSKSLGFDPALTAGPFETAFQDVVGISIFLGMATLLLPYLK